jgi:hypothetical protein
MIIDEFPIKPKGSMPIKGWPGYFAGGDGRIYSAHRGEFRRVAEWESGKPSCRYRKVTLYRTRCRRRGGAVERVAEKRNFHVHTLVALAFIGRRPRRKSEVRHRDGNRFNNRPHNLKWGTRRQNERDKVSHGTAPRGENNGRAKITALGAIALRSMNVPIKEAAAFFEISESQARRIRRGESWAVPEIARTKQNR